MTTATVATAKLQQQRRETFKAYVTLLRKVKLSTTDSDSFVEILHRLGKTGEDAARDLEVLRRASELRDLASGYEAARTALNKANEDLLKAHEAAKQAQEAEQQAKAQVWGAESDATRAATARLDLDDLQKAHPELLAT